MLSPLGKALRKLRIDRGWLLKDMAAGVGVPSSFLSAIETGRKNAPDDLVDRVARWAKLNTPEHQDLRLQAEMSQRAFRISLPEAASQNHREAAAVLARSFEFLTNSQLDQIRSIVKRGE